MISFNEWVLKEGTDLRRNYEKRAKVIGGELYKKGNIVQAWWEVDSLGREFNPPEEGRETWSYDSEEDAENGFKSLRNQFKEE